MHRALYTEILEDAPADARERERQAIERSIELLNAAKKMGPNSREAVRRLSGQALELSFGRSRQCREPIAQGASRQPDFNWNMDPARD